MRQDRAGTFGTARMSGYVSADCRVRRAGREGTDQQSSRNRFLAEIQQELLQCHRFIVDAEDQMAKLRQEEFDVLVGELPELVAEDIVNPDMVGIATAPLRQLAPVFFTKRHTWTRRDSGSGGAEGAAYVR